VTGAVARIRRHHPLVLWITGCNVAFALVYMLVVPLYRGPDEGAHVDMIRHYRAEAGEPAPDVAVPGRTVVRNVYADGSLEKAYVPPLGLRGRDAMRRSDRPTFAALGTPVPAPSNQMTQHPPLYYGVAAGLSGLAARVTPAGLWSYDREVLFYRLLSVLAIAPLALLASSALLGIGCTRGVAAVGAAFTLLIPQLTFVGSVVNNDGFMIFFSALAVAAGLRYLAGGSPRSAWLAAGAGAAAALTKSTGALVAAWALSVVFLGAFDRWKRGERAPARNAAAVASAIVAVGALWYVRNLVRYHTPQPAPQGHPRLAGSEHLSFVTFFPMWVDRLSRTFWAMPARRLGLALPWWVSHGLTVVAFAAVVGAIAFGRRYWKFTLPLLGLCVVQVLLLLRSGYRANRWHVPGLELAGVQGRYLFALVVPLAVFFGLAVSLIVGRAEPRKRSEHTAAGVALGTSALGFVLHLALARVMLARYWEGRDATFTERVHAVYAWSPLPAPLTGVVLALPFLIVVAALVTAVSASARSRAPAANAAVSKT
jgi:hypothetical protein